jgi:hypothetical protein
LSLAEQARLFAEANVEAFERDAQNDEKPRA